MQLLKIAKLKTKMIACACLAQLHLRVGKKFGAIYQIVVQNFQNSVFMVDFKKISFFMVYFKKNSKFMVRFDWPKFLTFF